MGAAPFFGVCLMLYSDGYGVRNLFNIARFGRIHAGIRQTLGERQQCRREYQIMCGASMNSWVYFDENINL